MDERKLKLEMYFLYRALIDTTEQRLLLPEMDERKLKLKIYFYTGRSLIPRNNGCCSQRWMSVNLN